MKAIVFGIMMFFLACVNAFAEEPEMMFRTVREAQKPFAWYIQRVQNGNAVLVGKLPAPPTGECVRQCSVVRSDNRAWLVLYRITGGIANIYECPVRFFDEGFVPERAALDTLVPIEMASLRRLSKEWNIRNYAGEYLLFFEESGVLKALPAVFPFGWEKCREHRKLISKNGVVGYNPKMKIWEKVSTRYTSSEEIESFEDRGQKQRIAVSEKIGNFTFTKERASVFSVRKEVSVHIFTGSLDLPDFPKSFVEINDVLWCFAPSAFPKKDKFLFRIRVKDGVVVSENLPFPFYFPREKEPIFDCLDSVMIKKDGVPGIIVPVKSGRGEDRVFWFDENRWAWTEECENGTKRIYDEAAATSEFREIQEKRLRKRTQRS